MRLDGKSQYQIKKEKLQKIRKMIAEHDYYWYLVKNNPEKALKEKPIDHLTLIKNILEIVKDE